MRQLAVVFAAAVIALACAATASAQAPSQDGVSGDALLYYDGYFGIYVAIDAKSDPSGENPSGTARIDLCSQFTSCTTASGAQGGMFTCLNVHGSRAILGYYGGWNVSPSYPTRFRGLIEVTDNGPPSAGPDNLDILAMPVDVWINPAPTPNPLDVPITDCPDELPSPPNPLAFHVFSGPLPGRPRPEVLQDFTVTDAQPLPSSKDQCKNGGWRTFGVFKNQGDCVSFVATKGKNPPARTPR